MKTPKSIEEITPSWLTEMSGLKIKSDTLKLTPNIQEGKGFLSNMVRVNAEDENGNPFCVVVKLQPDNYFLDMLLSNRFDESEIKCYRDLLPALVQECPDLAENLCGFIYGNIEEGESGSYKSVLVLEDLKPEGYTTIDFLNDLSPLQIEAGVKFLAKLHYSSYAWEAANEKSLVEVFPFVKPKGNAEMLELLRVSFEFMDGFLINHVELQAKMKKLAPLAQEAFKFILKPRNHCCIIHTDLWANNFMFSDQGKPVKAIDWQIVSYNDPMFDLVVFLISAIPGDELTKENMNKMLQLYYDTFMGYCKINGKLKNMRSFEDLSEYFYSIGMVWCFTWIAFSAEPMSPNPGRFLKILKFLDEEINVEKCVTDLLEEK